MSTKGTAPKGKAASMPEKPLDSESTGLDAPSTGTDTAPGATFDTDADPEVLLALQSLEERRAKAKRKRLVKIIVACCIAAVAVIAFVAYNAAQSTQAEEEAEDSQVAVVTRSDLSSAVQATGSLKPGSYVAITPEVPGVIEQVMVTEGQSVQAGDVLLTLRNSDLEKDIADAASALEKARHTAESAQAEVSQAYSSYDEAIAKFNDAVDAYNDGDSEVDPGTFDHSTYLSAIQSAEASATSAQDGISDAQRAYDYAIAQADKRTVYAPTAGTVLDLKAVAGAAVGGATGDSATSTATGSLMQIADLSSLSVDVEVNEIDIDNVKPDQRASVTFTAVPGLELEGTVTSLASVASNASTDGATGGGSGGVVTFKATITISTPDERLKPGMSANVSIKTKDLTDVIAVPASAVVEYGGEAFVLVTPDGTVESAESREVTLGERAGTQVVVESGLEEGESIVLGAAGDAADGTADGTDGTSGTSATDAG